MAKTSEALNIVVPATVRDLIDRAAKAAGMSRSEFIIAAAHREAEMVFLDRRLFTLEGKDFAAFKAALDRPPAEDLSVRRLLETPGPWDK